MADGVRFKLLTHARCHLGAILQEGLDHRGRGRRARDGGVLQFAGQIEIVGAAFAHGDTVGGAVHLFHVPQGRILAHQIGALDQHIGIGESDAGRPLRINGEESDVGLVLGDGVHGLAGTVQHNQFQRNAKPLRERAGEVHGHTRGFASGIAAGQNGVPQVDAGAQSARGREGGDDFLICLHGS
ncbi:hypothetical protein D3C72_1813070 [compost metagenome]